MLFTKYITILVLPIILAVATPMPVPNPLALPDGAPPTTVTKFETTTVTVTSAATETVFISQCNSGPVLCCNDVQPAGSQSATSLLGLLGVVLHDLNVLVGLSCDPLSALGVGSGGCAARPVCCENNTFNGLIAIGCVSININL